MDKTLRFVDALGSISLTKTITILGGGRISGNAISNDARRIDEKLDILVGQITMLKDEVAGINRRWDR
jgi:hypothetical protein